MKSSRLGDNLLSLLCGLALLAATRMLYGLFTEYLPDALLLSGADPLARLAFARFILFTALVALLALPLSWPLARHAGSRDLSTALPGAACALGLFLLLERTQFFSPFPAWLDFACGAVLFAALPMATGFWWRRSAGKN